MRQKSLKAQPGFCSYFITKDNQVSFMWCGVTAVSIQVQGPFIRTWFGTDLRGLEPDTSPVIDKLVTHAFGINGIQTWIHIKIYGIHWNHKISLQSAEILAWIQF